MSSFKIIQLSEKPLNKEDGEYINEEDVNEDALLLQNSDGWEVDNSKTSLEDACYYLNKIGRCNMKKRTFTFMEKSKLKKQYMESMEKVFKNWRKKMAKNQHYMGEYQLRTDVREACGVDSLLHYNDYLHNASGFIADYLSGFLPEKMYIGGIIDCHR